MIGWLTSQMNGAISFQCTFSKKIFSVCSKTPFFCTAWNLLLAFFPTFYLHILTLVMAERDMAEQKRRTGVGALNAGRAGWWMEACLVAVWARDGWYPHWSPTLRRPAAAFQSQRPRRPQRQLPSHCGPALRPRRLRLT